MIYAITLLAVFLCGSTHTSERLEAKPNIELSRFKKIMRDITDFLGIENLGYQAVSEKNEQLVRGIQHELAMDDFCIEIRGMSKFAQHILGRANAFVLPSPWFSNKSHAYLYISEEWFDGISELEKQALIRHELMHLKHDHARKKIKISQYLSIISKVKTYIIIAATAAKLNDPAYASYKKAIVGSAITSYIGMELFLAGLNAAYSRSIEKEADIEAAKTMDKKGLVSLFNELKHQYKDPESKFKIKRSIARFFKPLNDLFHSHPELDERIDYLENLA